jgi:hypothetical protein
LFKQNNITKESCLKNLLWLFMATKEKLENEDFVGLTEWGKG